MDEKYYLGIPGLLLSKSLDHEKVHTQINRYIDTIPKLAESIESNFANIKLKPNRYEYFMKNMDITLSLLQSVHARSLEREAETIMRSVESDVHMALAHKSMKHFISNLLSMSIEMQKAQRNADGKADASEAETNSGVARSLSTVHALIDEGDYERALSVIGEIAESIPEADAGDLFSLRDLMSAKKYSEATALAATLEEKYANVATEPVGTDLTKKILAVDDRPEILTFVSGALKNYYKVFGAPNGITAVKITRVQKPDLFILDIDMPGMDGFELAGIIRAKDAHRDTPIIFLTGNSDRERVCKAIRVGGNDFIVKPASSEILLRKVGKFMRRVEN